MTEIKLVKEHYREARELGLIKNKLNLVGLVFGSSSCPNFLSDKFSSEEMIEEINENLIKNAKKLKADHVFGVEYKSMTVSEGIILLAYGDAYKTTKDSSLPL